MQTIIKITDKEGAIHTFRKGVKARKFLLKTPVSKITFNNEVVSKDTIFELATLEQKEKLHNKLQGVE